MAGRRKKVLVTGAAGALGRNLVENLKTLRDGKNRTRGEAITVNDPSVLMEMVFFDDICEEIYDAMEGHPHRCHYEGAKAIPDENGRYCHCPVMHTATLGEIVELLHKFHTSQQIISFPGWRRAASRRSSMPCI